MVAAPFTANSEVKMTQATGPRTGERIPPLHVKELGGERRIPLRPEGRVANVVVTLHAGCNDCAAWLERLMERDADIRDWDGRVLAILDGADEPPAGVSPGGKTLRFAASEPRLAEKGIPTPAVLITDQWGELYAVEDAGTDHQFPTPDQVVEWLRYVAIQCPECQGEVL
jgi:hypothetical protein